MGFGAKTSKMRRMQDAIKRYQGVPIDLDVLVKAYAEDIWLVTKPARAPHLNHVRFEFDWSNLKMIPEKPKYNTRVNANKDQGSPQILKIFSSVYKNDTTVEQEYTVKDTRKTVSFAAIQVTSGLSLSHRGLSLELPKAKDTVLPRFMNICQTGGVQEVREEVEWTIGSTITAKPRSKVKVCMTIKEQQHSRDFQLDVELKGSIHINVFKKDSDKFLKRIDGNIDRIIDQAKEEGLTEPWTVYRQAQTATCSTHGTLVTRCQVDKHEVTTEMGLEEEESGEDSEEEDNSEPESSRHAASGTSSTGVRMQQEFSNRGYDHD